jgi:hypothetical protein
MKSTSTAKTGIGALPLSFTVRSEMERMSEGETTPLKVNNGFYREVIRQLGEA